METFHSEPSHPKPAVYDGMVGSRTPEGSVRVFSGLLTTRKVPKFELRFQVRVRRPRARTVYVLVCESIKLRVRGCTMRSGKGCVMDEETKPPPQLPQYSARRMILCEVFCIGQKGTKKNKQKKLQETSAKRVWLNSVIWPAGHSEKFICVM